MERGKKVNKNERESKESNKESKIKKEGKKGRRVGKFGGELRKKTLSGNKNMCRVIFIDTLT